MKLPFIPMSESRSRTIARHYIGLGERFAKFFPGLSFSLKQAEFDMGHREWVALGMYSALIYFSITFSALLAAFTLSGMDLGKVLGISFLGGFAIGSTVFFYFGYYPKLFVIKRVRAIEANLPHALRQLLIQVRSGMSLYNAIASVARRDYGLLSEAFRDVIKQVNTGRSEIEALEEMARKNPSLNLRRIMWQITNAMRTGADVGGTLKEIVDNIMTEQKVEIKNYGASLNPLALFYMMVVVIFPTLGIVFLLVMSSFVGLGIDLQLILMGILGFLAVFQVMFIGIVKTKRPTGI